tara:strand:- start:9573 stop:11540 length:1968 start_codon:yes stop_codon:yes gene_type:complete
MSSNYIKIINHLKTIKKYKILDKDGTIKLNYKLINDDLNNLNQDLISSLLSSDLCKSLFFDKIIDVYVFNQNKFIDIVFYTNEYIEGSHTKYENNIGLFLKDSGKIQLNFPYKDCVLVGGMDKEDDHVNLEVFYNEVLDADKIHKLFEPKVFHNATRFSYSKEKAENDKIDNPRNIQVYNNVDKIEFEKHIDENGYKKENLKDNLIIKGNNLLGLHSLAKNMSETIDVIYIDPPYYFNETKKADAFAYNSNFKLSSWLTFMKNRLEIAREMLSESGVIFISTHEIGIEHLKILSSEIFGNSNFISNLIWKKTYTLKNDKKEVTTQQEYILMFSKNKHFVNINKDELKKDYVKNTYTKDDNDGRGLYRTVQLYKKKNPNEYKVTSPSGKEWIKPWNYNKEGWKRLEKENLIYWGKDGNACPSKKVYLSKSKGQGFGSFLPEDKVGYTGDGGKNIENLGFKRTNFMYTKPISLINHLLKISSKKDSIILDFFAGSGTTAHSVLSLNKEDRGNRKFILLEQMEYVENITSERVRRAMVKNNFEDSFVYMEMMESEYKRVKNKIKNSKSENELISIVYDNFDKGYFINIKNKEELNVIIKDLILKNKKNGLNIAIKNIIEKYMDNNLDYISYKDIEELKYSNNISNSDYLLNKNFYKKD